MVMGRNIMKKTKKVHKLVIRALVLAFALVSMKIGYADNSTTANSGPTADIHIQISGTSTATNRYFLCVPNVGCLKITGGDAGKTYRMVDPIELNNIYVTDSADMSVYYEGAPKSCQITVAPKQTVTIRGHLNSADKIEGLNCSL